MQGISKNKHQALAAALQQLAELATVVPQSGVSAKAIYEGLLALSGTFERYEYLLAELADCIADYERLHHHLKVNVLAPHLRGLRRLSEPDTPEYDMLLEQLQVVRAV